MATPAGKWPQKMIPNVQMLRTKFAVALPANVCAKTPSMAPGSENPRTAGYVGVLAQLAPLGPAYQAGTLSGNPVATACGLATLHEIAKPGFYDALGARTRLA